jgi:hypothetical protein
MIDLDASRARLPIVLVVDPIAASRFTMWRLLSGSFGVLEASDARGAHAWLGGRRRIDALIVREDLPDARGDDLVKSLAGCVDAASRAIVVSRSPDLLDVAARLARWFFARDARTARALRREAERLVS